MSRRLALISGSRSVRRLWCCRIPVPKRNTNDASTSPGPNSKGSCLSTVFTLCSVFLHEETRQLISCDPVCTLDSTTKFNEEPQFVKFRMAAENLPRAFNSNSEAAAMHRQPACAVRLPAARNGRRSEKFETILSKTTVLSFRRASGPTARVGSPCRRVRFGVQVHKLAVVEGGIPPDRGNRASSGLRRTSISLRNKLHIPPPRSAMPSLEFFSLQTTREGPEPPDQPSFSRINFSSLSVSAANDRIPSESFSVAI